MKKMVNFMKNKSQVSAFIIIGALIIGIIILFLLFRTLDFNEIVNPEVQPIHSFVESCIKEVGEEAVYEIGRNGGYFISQEPSLEETIPYYLYEKKNYMPLKEKIEEELSTYIEFMIPFCVNGFENFEELKVSEKEILVKTTIEDENVVFAVDYPIHISKDNASYSLKNFNQKIPVRLGIIYQAITEIMEEQMKKTDSVCATCLYYISETYDLNFHVLDANETNTLLFVVRDEELKILERDYQFYFANKLDEIK